MYFSFQVVALVYKSENYVNKCLWLKILSNKIIQVYSRHCKIIIMSCNSHKWHAHYINVILENAEVNNINLRFHRGSFDYEFPY